MLLQELFEQKQQYLSRFFEQVDLKQAEQFLEKLKACQGTFVFTGVGKSGLVAEKIAVTMTSTGSRSLYISPTNALHGDLGILNENDVCIMLSKSGESDELLRLVPYLQQRKIPIFSILSSGNSRLAKACQAYMVLPVEKELCPYNLAPTTSTVTQLIFGDILAIALMRSRNFQLEQYLWNHPAGSIGKRHTLKVKDLMWKGELLPLGLSTDKLLNLLVEMSVKRAGCILIVNTEKTLQGIFTDGDLRRTLLHQGSQSLEKPISELMTKTPRTVHQDLLAWDALQLMERDPQHAITAMPVVDSQQTLQGLIRLHDIIQAGL